MTLDPHAGQPLGRAGAPLPEAAVAMLMVHGRGSSPEGILSLSTAFDRNDVAYLAPRAAGGSWYPRSFLAPTADHEPWLSSALDHIGGALEHIVEAGVPASRTVILGFSQGACLVLELAARHPRRYGGVVALSGGLIGTADLSGRDPPEDKCFDYSGDFEGTPVFLGCGDPDPHIPIQRVHDTAAILQKLGARVTDRIYPGAPHAVNDDEIEFVRELLDSVARQSGDALH